MSTTSENSVTLTVPELGGALGRVSAPRSGRGDVRLDGIRIGLATDLFLAAGEARDHAVRGDTSSAVEALEAGVWAEIWERAVSAAGRELADRILAEFQAAAVESRMPRPYLKRWIPTEPERRALTAHLGKGSRRLDLALAELTRAAASLQGGAARESTAFVEWSNAVDLCARRIEAAWIELLEAAERERRRWSLEIERVRQWHRPRWPMWLVSGLLLVVALYLGLVFGGFVQPPELLRPWAEFWWNRL